MESEFALLADGRSVPNHRDEERWMKFCTTCGRNFADDIESCPHDSTPLFYMGGEPGPVAQAEPDSDLAIEAAGVAAELDAVEASEPSEDSDLKEPSDSVDAPVASDEDHDDVEDESEDDVEGDSEDDSEEPVVADGSADEEDQDSFEQEEAPSMQIQGSIASTIADLGGLTEEQSALSLDREVDISEERNPDLLAPVTHTKKSGGNGGMIGLIVVVVIAVVAGYYFMVMKPAEDEAARLKVEQEAAQLQKTEDEKPVAIAPEVVEEIKVVPPDAGNTDASASADAADAADAGQTAAQVEPAVVKAVVRKPKVRTKPADKPVDKPEDQQVDKPADKPKVEAKEPTAEDLLKKELQKLKQGEE
jgi:hypothetical protein